MQRTGRKYSFLMGAFTLTTLVLAGAAIGRKFGVGLLDILYMVVCLLVVTGFVTYRIALRRSTNR